MEVRRRSSHFERRYANGNVLCGEFNMGMLPEEDLMRSIRLFGSEVIPALRDFDPIRTHLS